MAQKTDLNVTPYYDDYDEADQFHKVLFKPGKAVQARELTTLQSIQQNQIERFGRHIFKEGSIVIPGSVGYDENYYALKVQATYVVGTNTYTIANHLANYVGTQITGATSGVKARVIGYAVATSEDPDTLFIKYIASGTDYAAQTFSDGENISSDVALSLQGLDSAGNSVTTSFGATNTTAITQATGAVATGSAVTVTEGVFFVRGMFVQTTAQTLVLDKYTNVPSYRVGFDISETLVSHLTDESLKDNSQGTTNFAADGADRLKVTLTLAKHILTGATDTNFVELMRLEAGSIKSHVRYPEYSVVEDMIARRTMEESGDYFVKPFTFDIKEHLDDGINNGLYKATDSPAGDTTKFVCQISPGKAYVAGREIELISTSTVEFDKARTVDVITDGTVAASQGQYANVINVYGTPDMVPDSASVSSVDTMEQIQLFNRQTVTRGSSSGTHVGYVRAKHLEFNSGTAGSSATNATSKYKLYLFDINMFTDVTMSEACSLTTNALITGATSGATGLVVSGTSSNTNFVVQNVIGKFSTSEAITSSHSGDTVAGTTSTVLTRGFSQDVKQFFMPYTNNAGDGFTADLDLDVTFQLSGNYTFGLTDRIVLEDGNQLRQEFGSAADDIVGDEILAESVSAGLVGTNQEYTEEIVVGDIIGLPTGSTASALETRRVTAIGTGDEANVLTMDSAFSTTASGVLATRKRGEMKEPSKSHSFFQLPHQNIKTLLPTDTSHTMRRQFVVNTATGGVITLNAGTDEVFVAHTEQDYNIHILTLGTSTSGIAQGDIVSASTGFVLSNSNQTLTITNAALGTTSSVKVTTTLSRADGVHKTKTRVKMSTLTVTNNTSSSTTYGHRVEDRDISLGVADGYRCWSVLESAAIGTTPTFPTLTVSGATGTMTDGEQIIGSVTGAKALVVDHTGSSLQFVYQGTTLFTALDAITGQTSGFVAEIDSIAEGSTDISYKYSFDDGQRDGFYDIARIRRKPNQTAPVGQLLIVFDYFTHGAGDFFSADSYTNQTDYDQISSYQGTKLSDVIDFRPKVADISTSGANCAFVHGNKVFEGSGSSATHLPGPDDTIQLDYQTYLGRADKLFLTDKGRFIVQKGIPSENPVYPNQNVQGAMMIAGVAIQPYTFNERSVRLQVPANRRWTMKDITGLSRRLRDIERTITLSLLEKNAENFRVLDSDGFDRFKTGFIVDNFESHGVGNIFHDDYSGSVDRTRKEFRPEHDVQTVELIEENTTDSDRLDDHYVRKVDMAMLPYEHVAMGAHSNKFASRVENLNPFSVIFWPGTITLDPESDLWIDTDRAPAFTVNIEGDYDQWLSWMGNKTTRTDWKSWQTDSVDVDVGFELSASMSSSSKQVNVTREGGIRNAEGSAAEGNLVAKLHDTETTIGMEIGGKVSVDVGLNQSRAGTRFDLEEFRQNRSAGDETTMEVIPWMRARDVTVVGTGFKPNTQLYPLFNGRHVTNQTRPAGISVASSDLTSDVGKADTVINVESTVGFPNAPAALTISTVVDPTAADRTFDPGDLASGSADQYRWSDTSGSSYVTSEKMVYSAKSDTSFTISERGADGTTAVEHKAYTHPVTGVANTRPVATSGVRGLPLVTNNLGEVAATFSIPNTDEIRFPIGKGVFRLTDNANDSRVYGVVHSAGEAIYQAFGQQQTKQERMNALRQGRVSRDDTLSQTRVIKGGDSASASASASTTATTSVGGFHGWYDPLAQSISIQDVDFPDGCFVTKVDVYFKTKDVSSQPAPVTIQLRTVVNGYPSDEVLPGSQITLPASSVNVSDTATTATTFTFEWPQHLKQMQEYAIVLISTSLDYTVWLSRIGEVDVGGTSTISEQPYLGSLFKSQNATAWTASQYEDLKFDLYRAKFDISKSANVMLVNQELDRPSGFVAKSDGLTRYLAKNPVEVKATSTKVKIDYFGHGMYSTLNNVIIKDVHSEISDTTLNEGAELTATDTTITLTSATNFASAGYIKIDDEVIQYTGKSGNAVTGCTRGSDGTTATTHEDGSTVQFYVLAGIPLTEINKTHTAISGIELDSFEITTTTAATKTMTAGGSNALITKNVPFDTMYNKVKVMTLPLTSVDTYAQVTTGKTLGSPDSGAYTQTPFSRTANADKFQIPLYENWEFTRPYVITSQINETNELGGDKSFRLTNTMTSTSDAVTPIVDLGKGQAGVICIANRINKVDSSSDVGTLTNYRSSTEPAGDNNACIYLTKEIRLKQEATAIKVMIDASVQDESEIECYYKIKRSSMETPFEDIEWTGFNTTGIPDSPVPVSVNAGDFREYEFTAGNNDDVATTTLPLEDFSSFAIKLVLKSLNTSKPPMIANFRALALAV